MKLSWAFEAIADRDGIYDYIEAEKPAETGKPTLSRAAESMANEMKRRYPSSAGSSGRSRSKSSIRRVIWSNW